MKLICLNTWGGRVFNPLMQFIKDSAKDTDIFCFQEIFKTTENIKVYEGFRVNLFNEFSKILNDHHGYFTSALDNYITGSFQQNFISFNVSAGLAIFIKKGLTVKDSGDFFIFGNNNSFNPSDVNSVPRNLQYLSFTFKSKEFMVCNLHGLWVRGPKIDTESRIQQSKKIKKFLDKQNCAKIICGDFNLDINTQSIKILEGGMENLIKKYKISTTRSKLFPRSDKFADYIFVSDKVNVLDFKVPNIEVSDHLPLILEFS